MGKHPTTNIERPTSNDGGRGAWAEVRLVGGREQAPPGWKRRLYGRQDARRYGGRVRAGGAVVRAGRSRMARPAGAVCCTRARFGGWTLLRVTDPRSEGRRWLVHGFLAEYGRSAEKIIRAHSALGWEGRGYWGKAGSKIEILPKSGKLI